MGRVRTVSSRLLDYAGMRAFCRDCAGLRAQTKGKVERFIGI